MFGTLINSSLFDCNMSSTLLPTTISNLEHYLVCFAYAATVYYSPSMIIAGLIGNFVSLYVFFATNLRLQSTSQYLSALSVSDSMLLLQLSVPWLNEMQLTGVFVMSGFCEMFVYFTYVTCYISTWLVVAFTFERFVAVVYPLQRNYLCTVQRARYVIIGVVLSSILINVPIIRFTGVTTNDCDVEKEFMDYAWRFNLADTMFTFTVPLSIIVFLNGWIIYGMYKLERDRQALLRDAAPISLPSICHARAMQCYRSQRRVTKMLLIVSSVYVLFNLPTYALRILAYKYTLTGERWDAIQQLASACFITNFGINFILYCLSGQNFRRALVEAFTCRRKQARRAAARLQASLQARTSVSSISIDGPSAAYLNNERLRRCLEEPVIARWTFNNRRQLLASQTPELREEYEMRVIRRQPITFDV